MTKGKRRERQAKAIYEQAGYAVANPERSKYGANDFYNHWDLVAMQPGRKPRFVQVKSNVARGIGKCGGRHRTTLRLSTVSQSLLCVTTVRAGDC
jgi:hypothetical protein